MGCRKNVTALAFSGAPRCFRQHASGKQNYQKDAFAAFFEATNALGCY